MTRQPLSVEEFLVKCAIFGDYRDPKWFKWVEHFRSVFEDTEVSEVAPTAHTVINSGDFGNGKSSITLAMMLYDMHCLFYGNRVEALFTESTQVVYLFTNESLMKLAHDIVGENPALFERKNPLVFMHLPIAGNKARFTGRCVVGAQIGAEHLASKSFMSDYQSIRNRIESRTKLDGRLYGRIYFDMNRQDVTKLRLQVDNELVQGVKFASLKKLPGLDLRAIEVPPIKRAIEPHLVEEFLNTTEPIPVIVQAAEIYCERMKERIALASQGVV